ncbi:MAG: hypothetical protein WA952_08540 [Lewinella sp.]
MRSGKFNLFYLAVLVAGAGLFLLLSDPPGDGLSLYGFAESIETEVNYNYPVEVTEILVRAGEPVDSGQALLRLVRRNPKVGLADQPYRIDELRAEEAAWRDQREQSLRRLETEEAAELATLDEQVAELESEINYRRTAAGQLSSVTITEGDHQPLLTQLENLRNERERVETGYDQRETSIRSELRFGQTPYRERIRRIEAEAEFERTNLEQEIILTAPARGFIGGINCREGEFKSAYATLVTFYEPHSELVKGYLHEDQAVTVTNGDRFLAVSLQDESLSYEGEVIGLGSRIVEIPERLRRFPEIKSYGREVTVAIPLDNRFLQKEKVGLRYLRKAAKR